MHEKIFRNSVIVSAFVLCAAIAFNLTPGVALASDQPNLIKNPSVEESNGRFGRFPLVGRMPTGWNINYEARNQSLNTRDITIFYYTPAGHNSRHAIKTTVYSLRSIKPGSTRGWFFDEVSVLPQKKYLFSDFYKSNMITYISADFKLSNGEYVTMEVGQADPSRNWKKFETTFISPAEAVSVTITHHLKSRGYLITDDYYLGEAEAPPPPPPPPPPSNNLILNPSLELGTTLPNNWRQGNWGTNTATFVYPDAGHSGKGAGINISSHTDGDAKWYFDDINVIPGEKYTFSDFYKSTVPTQVTVRYTNSDGTYLYLDFGYPAASADWKQFSYSFIVPQNVVSLTVFHLIEAVGWLAIDDFSLVKESSSGNTFNRGMVTLSFDDGWLSTYQNGLPILSNYGIKSTQYIFTDALGTAGYITSSRILDIQNQGHEIGAHSLTHSDLTTLTDAQIANEILGSKQALQALGANTITSFAYPYGEWNENIKNILRQSGYQGARTAMLRDGGFNYANQDPYLLRTFSVEVDTPVSEIQQWLNQAVNNKTWAILVFHQIENGGGQYSTTPQNLNSVASYISANNIKTVTIGQGLSELNR